MRDHLQIKTESDNITTGFQPELIPLFLNHNYQDSGWNRGGVPTSVNKNLERVARKAPSDL